MFSSPAMRVPGNSGLACKAERIVAKSRKHEEYVKAKPFRAHPSTLRSYLTPKNFISLNPLDFFKYLIMNIY